MGEWHKPKISIKKNPDPKFLLLSWPQGGRCRTGFKDGTRKRDTLRFILPVSATYWLKGPQRSLQSLWNKIPGRNSHFWQELPLPTAGGGTRWVFKVFPTQIFLCFSASPTALRGEFGEGGGWGWCYPHSKANIPGKYPSSGCPGSKQDWPHPVWDLLPAQLGFVTSKQQQEQNNNKLLIMNKNPGIKPGKRRRKGGGGGSAISQEFGCL